MLEALLTGLGLTLGVVATLTSLLHEDKPSTAKRFLFALALVGLGVGLYTTYLQYDGRTKAEKAATDEKNSLTDIQGKVGTLEELNESIREKTSDLTGLDQLGSAQYYVVLDTFTKGSTKDDVAYAGVRKRLLSLYPKAEVNKLLWTGPAPNNQSKYQLRFGRHLSPSAAEVFQRLAKEGSLANGNPILGREH